MQPAPEVLMAEALYLEAPYPVLNWLELPLVIAAYGPQRKRIHQEIAEWGLLVTKCQEFLRFQCSLNDVLFARARVWEQNRLDRKTKKRKEVSHAL